MEWTRGRTRDERGAAALEFGLIAPVLILLVFGIVDFGLMINRDMIVGSASRDGARQASLGATYSEIRTAVQTELTQNGIAAGPKTVITVCAQALSTACTADSGSTNYATRAVPGANVAVTVRYQYEWITPLVSSLFDGGTTLTQYTQMRRE